MLDTAGIRDLRRYIKLRLAYARYRVGSTYTKVWFSDVQILDNGVVRVQLVINSGAQPITVNRVELYNADGELWAHQKCSITLGAGQTGILFWFDFKITEVS